MSTFQNAKVVSVGTNPAAYHRTQPVQRGHRDYVMSRSELMEFARCPHRWLVGYERKESAALLFGGLLDCLLFTPSQVGTQSCVHPDTYPGPKGEAKPWSGRKSEYGRQWYAEREASGMQVVKPDDMNDAHKLAERLRDDFSDVLTDSDFQVLIEAQYVDAATGIVVPIKGLLDIVQHGPRYRDTLFDFKTANCASLSTWPKFTFAFNYHVQAAMYLDLWNAANPDYQRIDFRHIGCESEPPHEPFRRVLSSEFIEIGRMSYQNALRRYAQCLATGVWGGYDERAEFAGGFSIVNPAPWMMSAGAEEYWIEPAENKNDPDDIIP